MGYAFATAACFGCGRDFYFNPHRVPSIRYDNVREPICLDCVNLANPRRVARGLDPIRVLPGAYEPIREEEL